MGFNRGIHTLTVSTRLHRLNRQRLVERLRLNPALGSNTNAIVLLQGGCHSYRNCSDHEPLFRQESFFHWAFGVQEPDFYGAIEVRTGRSVLFAPKLPESYAVWMGKLKTQADIQHEYGVDEVQWVENLKQALAAFKPDQLLTLYGPNSDSGLHSKVATFSGIEEFQVNRDILHHEICDLRAIKTEEEIEVLRFAASISSQAHKEVMRKIRPGMQEYQLESIFQHYCSYHGGSRFLAYTCICASGQNSSILHYGHSGEPNNKKVEDGDMCMFDMGCEYDCYCADITCSFPANGKFTEQQKIIYNAVLDANQAVSFAVRPGVSWVEMHLLAERKILEGLKNAGLLVGSVDDMLVDRLGAIFLPHGLGHLLGIDTHDVGGYLKGYPERRVEPGLRSLRTARILEKGMCITIEPGCYFVEALLNQAFEDPKLSKYLVKEEIEKYRNFGGVRIEDDVVITDNGMELLNDVPRTVEEIEALMAEGRKEQVYFPQLKSLKN